MQEKQNPLILTMFTAFTENATAKLFPCRSRDRKDELISQGQTMKN